MNPRYTALSPVQRTDGTALIPVQRRNEVIAYATVDADDAERLCRFGWGLNGAGYVKRSDAIAVTIFLHREVLRLPHRAGGVAAGVVDHINGDILDNRRSNLRHVTNTENRWNLHGTYANNQSGHRGVCLHNGSWKAYASAYGRQFDLGHYATREDAARVAECGRMLLHGSVGGRLRPVYGGSSDRSEVRAAAQAMAARFGVAA